TETPKIRLEPLDARQALAGDRGAVGDTTRQTSGGGLVPEGDPELARDGAHVGLRHACFDERAASAGEAGRFEPRAIVAEIVEVRAVEHVIELPLLALALGDFVELRLAVKAAIGAVGGVAFPLDLPGLHPLVPRP